MDQNKRGGKAVAGEAQVPSKKPRWLPADIASTSAAEPSPQVPPPITETDEAPIASPQGAEGADPSPPVAPQITETDESPPSPQVAPPQGAEGADWLSLIHI